MADSKITCPNCQVDIDVNKILVQQIEAQKTKEYLAREKALQAENENNLKKILDEKSALEAARSAFEDKKRKENELFAQKLEEGLKSQRAQILIDTKRKIELEQEERFKEMQNELNEKSTQLIELNKSKSEIEKLKREKNEMQEKIMAESERRLSEQLQIERQKISESFEHKNEMHIKELQKQLDDQKKLTEEMKRKQEQGSMQLQGEVQELAIEEWLRNEFRLDTINEIKKGARGADCLHIIHTHERQNCGTIYYESKRTKDFQPSWIEKFKADIRDKNADIGILVTDALPSGMERLGIVDGVWICTYNEFKGLSLVLRENVIRLSQTLLAQENRGDKMHLLYDYLTGNNFRMQVEAIVEGFSQMRSDLETEKRSFTKIWKQREKQLDKVLLNTIEMYGSVKGIAGNSVKSIKALEIDDMIDEDEIENDLNN